ncbi:putative repeat protein (TIGR01451 family) [Comamonas odontotermitis]|uniref:Repeat protein (TIGR01451 family) n=1 Tax=Comamonas odontotermitis TaxID=379895 RepID=A0ABR6RIX6_9BURK|nr:Ig-like domain-containing protein [Comamonas odontotermitis]MBB6579130.1 putative repeat protein (TIGR01451 family) [Comamonas odontotermitis]
MTYTFSPAVPANRVAFIIFDVGVGTNIPPAYTPTLTLSVTGGASPSSFSFSSLLDNTNSPMNPLTYTPATGVFSKTSSVSTVRESGAVVGNSNALVSSLTVTTAGLDALDLVGYGLPSIPTCITTRKISVGGTGSFSFANTNLSTLNTVLTTTAMQSPVDSVASFVPDPASAVSITESVSSSPPGWRLAGASCTDANSGVTGNIGAFGLRSGNTLTVSPGQLSPIANITCTLTNSFLVAVDDTQTTPMNIPVNGIMPIFSNDTGGGISLSALDGSVCTSFPCIRNIANGTIAVDASGNYLFSPSAGFTGVASIPYEIIDAAGLTATANIVITVTPVPQLSLTKASNGPWSVQQSGAFYSLRVANSGSAATTGVITVRDSLPAGLSASDGIYGGWSCQTSGGEVICTSDISISVGATATIHLPVSVDASAVPGVVNQASVGGGGDPFNGGNPPAPGSCPAGDSHCAKVATVVNAQANLNIAKTNGVSAVASGSFVTYTVTISNPGSTSVNGLSWSDSAGSGLSDLAITGQSADGKGSESGLCVNLACTGISLVGGGSVTYTVMARVTGAVGSKAENSAVLIGGHCIADGPCISTDSDPIEPVNALPVPARSTPTYVILALAILLLAGSRLHASKARQSQA